MAEEKRREYAAWAEKLGVRLKTTGEEPGGMFSIEHPDGTSGFISTDCAMTAALMSIRGESDRTLRTYLYDNTVQRSK